MSDANNIDLGWANPRPWTCQIENGRAVIRDRTGTEVSFNTVDWEEAVTVCRAVNLFDDLVALLQKVLSTSAADRVGAVQPGWYQRAIAIYAKAVGMEPQT